MLGDTAVMVHPDDERYAALVGKTVGCRCATASIPVIADAYVDREFGTGVVKVTPAHDANDYAVGQRHGLPLIGISRSTHDQRERARPLRGLDRFVARKRVVADLEAQGLLVEEEAPTDGAALRAHRPGGRADVDRPVVRRHDKPGADAGHRRRAMRGPQPAGIRARGSGSTPGTSG